MAPAMIIDIIQRVGSVEARKSVDTYTTEYMTYGFEDTRGDSKIAILIYINN